MADVAGSYGGWSYYVRRTSWFFEQLITFGGSDMTINLDPYSLINAIRQFVTNLPALFQVNFVEQIFNDTTARDYAIRLYTNPAFSYYSEFVTKTANVELTRLDYLSIAPKYPASCRIQLYYSNFTAGKTVRIRIQVDEA